LELTSKSAPPQPSQHLPDIAIIAVASDDLVQPAMPAAGGMDVDTPATGGVGVPTAGAEGRLPVSSSAEAPNFHATDVDGDWRYIQIRPVGVPAPILAVPAADVPALPTDQVAAQLGDADGVSESDSSGDEGAIAAGWTKAEHEEACALGCLNDVSTQSVCALVYAWWAHAVVDHSV